MSTLLQLPQEIRELIIEHVLLAKRAQWNDNALAAAELGSHDGRNPRLPKLEAYASNSTTLLLICKSIRDETLGVLRRKFSTPDYSVDVVALHEWELAYTWTRIPVLSDRCGTVDIDLRHHGTAFEKSLPAGGWKLDGFPPMPKMLARWGHFFRGVLASGPAPRSHDMVIEKLRLNFVTPAKVVPAPGWKERRDNYDPAKFGYLPMIWREDGMVENEVIVTEISRTIEWMLGNERFLPKSLPALLWERVGTLDFCVDGKLRKRLDFNEKLQRLLSGIERPRFSVPSTARDTQCPTLHTLKQYRQQVGLWPITCSKDILKSPLIPSS